MTSICSKAQRIQVQLFAHLPRTHPMVMNPFGGLSLDLIWQLHSQCSLPSAHHEFPDRYTHSVFSHLPILLHFLFHFGVLKIY